MKITKLFAFAAMVIMALSCREEKPQSTVITVKGPLHVSELGQCLTHEHILVDWAGADSTGYHRWEKDSVILSVIPYLEEIRELGVTSFFDCSPAYLGRDPVILLELSERTGINIITNTGYYGAVDNRFIPAHAWEETDEEIAGRWIDEFNNGIDGTTVKPGFIKIGVSNGPLSEFHQKLVRAAAIAHKHTGLTIKSHTGEDVPAFQQIQILEAGGVDPEAFIWTHAQRGSPEKLAEAARSGAWISLDGINISSSRNNEETGNMDFYIERLQYLKEQDLLDKVLISHDAGWYTAGETGGGPFRGYGDIYRFLLPALLENGFTNSEIKKLLTINPANAFEVRVRLLD